jgi:hypothetical protein
VVIAFSCRHASPCYVAFLFCQQESHGGVTNFSLGIIFTAITLAVVKKVKNKNKKWMRLYF